MWCKVPLGESPGCRGGVGGGPWWGGGDGGGASAFTPPSSEHGCRLCRWWPWGGREGGRPGILKSQGAVLPPPAHPPPLLLPWAVPEVALGECCPASAPLEGDPAGLRGDHLQVLERCLRGSETGCKSRPLWPWGRLLSGAGGPSLPPEHPSTRRTRPWNFRSLHLCCCRPRPSQEPTLGSLWGRLCRQEEKLLAPAGLGCGSPGPTGTGWHQVAQGKGPGNVGFPGRPPQDGTEPGTRGVLTTPGMLPPSVRTSRCDMGGAVEKEPRAAG